MSTNNERWLDSMLERNEAFRRGADVHSLPVVRIPGRTALLTCIDPRVNLGALGILPFGPRGEGHSDVRVMRTIGAIAEERSLIIGIHLAGIRELAVVMHTDCGNTLARQRIDSIIEGLQRTMGREELEALKARTGQAWPAGLIAFLKAFDDPRDAVRAEVESIKARPFVPADMVVHGLVYNLETGALDLVVNGYR